MNGSLFNSSEALVLLKFNRLKAFIKNSITNNPLSLNFFIYVKKKLNGSVEKSIFERKFSVKYDKNSLYNSWASTSSSLILIPVKKLFFCKC